MTNNTGTLKKKKTRKQKEDSGGRETNSKWIDLDHFDRKRFNEWFRTNEGWIMATIRAGVTDG